MPRPVPQRLIGWREWLTLPEWGVPAIKAKVDTGARTSALHAADLEDIERDGAHWIRFVIHPWQRNLADPVTVEAPVVERRAVTSSSGAKSRRPVVMAAIQLGDHRIEAEVTLTRRDSMGFRMLLGREAIRGIYAVDPGRSYLAGRPDLEVRRRNRGRS